MTREGVLSYAHALKLNQTVDLNLVPDFAESVIKLLNEDCIRIPNNTIKWSGKEEVFYRKDYLRKHWTLEMELLNVEMPDRG